MANTKRNNFAARSIIVGLSVLAGLGIWTAVARPSTAASGISSPPAANSSFGVNDNFLTQAPPQTSTGGSSQYPVQQAPAPRFRTRAS
jgi:hypothetical protein